MNWKVMCSEKLCCIKPHLWLLKPTAYHQIEELWGQQTEAGICTFWGRIQRQLPSNGTTVKLSRQRKVLQKGSKGQKTIPHTTICFNHLAISGLSPVRRGSVALGNISSEDAYYLHMVMVSWACCIRIRTSQPSNTEPKQANSDSLILQD